MLLRNLLEHVIEVTFNLLLIIRSIFLLLCFLADESQI